MLRRSPSARPTSTVSPGLGRRFDRAYAQYPGAAPSLRLAHDGVAARQDRASSGALEAPVEDAVSLQNRFRVGGYLIGAWGPIYGGPAESAYGWGLAEDASDPAAAARRRGVTHRRPPGRAPLPGRRARRVEGPGGPPRPGAHRTGRTSVGRRPRDRRFAGARRSSRAPGAPDTACRRTAGAASSPLERARGLRGCAGGTVLEALDRSKLWDRVTVVFVVGPRSSTWEGTGRCCARTFSSRRRSGRRSSCHGAGRQGARAWRRERFAELVDVYPTLVDLCGLQKARGLQGTSLVPLLQDPSASVKTAVFSVAARAAGYLGRSVRTDRYRYTEWPDGSEELYDHDQDPHEWTNLRRHPRKRAPILELRGLLDERDRLGNPPSRPSRRRPKRGAKKPQRAPDRLRRPDGPPRELRRTPSRRPSIDRLAARGPTLRSRVLPRWRCAARRACPS